MFVLCYTKGVMKSSRNVRIVSAKKSKGKSKSEYVKPMRPAYLAPTTFVQQEVRPLRIRCSVSAAISAGTITMAQLGGMLGIISLATGAGSASSLICDQAKLKRVCVWGPVATAGTPVTVQLKYVDDPTSSVTSGPPKTVSDSSVSFDRPAYACLEPPKREQSFFSQWFDTNQAIGYVVITCPVGSIVDFWFNWILDDQGATSAGPVITAASVIGQIYHRSITTGGGVIGCVSPLNGIT